MPIRRHGVLLALLAGCGPAVETTAEGTTSGGVGTGTTRGTSSAAAATGSSEDSSSGGSTTTAESSSSGEVPELIEFEGVLRYDADVYKSPLWFESCDGLEIGLDLWTEPGLPNVQRCGGMYARFLATIEPTGHFNADQLAVREVLQWRPCEPNDCGGDACEPLQCLWECSPLEQDCAPSDKCAPYSTDGGLASAAACVPIPKRPDALGEACTRSLLGFGADSCDAGAVCMGGFEERTGVCVQMCQGSRLDPTCDEGRCVFSSTGGPYCLPECEPGCDGICTSTRFDPVATCIPEPGLPELLEPCEGEEEGCEGDFVCSVAGSTQGLCVSPP